MKTIYKILIVLIPSIALLASGTYGLLSSTASTASDNFVAGTVKVNAYYGCGCGSDENDPTINNFTNLIPDKSRSGSMSIENTGSLDAWVRFQAQSPFPDNQLSIDYAVTVYGPSDSTATNDTSSKDGNGDLHSNCHTGSKWRGAGGEDKGEIQIGKTVTDQNFISGDFSKPFMIPAGDFAVVTYSYKVQKLDKTKENSKGELKMNLQAVQYDHNVQTNPDGTTSPIDWQPQKQVL